MATGQVLFHRFYCKKSFARFNVKVKLCSTIILYFLDRHGKRGNQKKEFFEIYLWCSSYGLDTSAKSCSYIEVHRIEDLILRMALCFS